MSHGLKESGILCKWSLEGRPLTWVVSRHEFHCPGFDLKKTSAASLLPAFGAIAETEIIVLSAGIPELPKVPRSDGNICVGTWLPS